MQIAPPTCNSLWIVADLFIDVHLLTLEKQVENIHLLLDLILKNIKNVKVNVMKKVKSQNMKTISFHCNSYLAVWLCFERSNDESIVTGGGSLEQWAKGYRLIHQLMCVSTEIS